MVTPPPTVLLTDRAWPDDCIERGIIESNGFQFVDATDLASSEEELHDLARTYNPVAIMTCWSNVSANMIQSPSDLRIVTRLGIGLDNIAVDAATQRGVWVSNVPDYCVEEVSDHAMAFILALTRQVAVLTQQVKSGHWYPSGARLRRLSSMTVGLVGYGRIGRRLGEKLRPFAPRVLAHSRSGVEDPGVEPVPLEELLRESHVVVLTLPLTEATRGLINAQRLALMRPDAFLINVSRGGLVQNEALVASLLSGHLAGAALDVVDGEPMVPRGLLTAPGLVITPHVAFSSDVSIAELRSRAAQEVIRVLHGDSPVHACNRVTPVRPHA